jgi:hypothetical protein
MSILAKIAALVLIAAGMLGTYLLGFRAGREAGWSAGRDEGWREGKRAGAKKGFAVGYDRGRREQPQPAEEESGEPERAESRWQSVLPLALIVIATMIVLSVLSGLMGTR